MEINLGNLGLVITANAASYIAKTPTLVDCAFTATKPSGVGRSPEVVLDQPAIQNSCPLRAGKLWQLVFAAAVLHDVTHLPAAHQKRIGQ